MENTNLKYDEHFRKFASLLEAEIAKFPPVEDSLAKQKQQMEGLVSLERQFRDTLISHKWGDATYREFLEYIKNEKRNILSARPFFRERLTTFTNHISRAFKQDDYKELQKYDINYEFVKYVLNQKKWGKTSQLRVIANKIMDLRREIAIQNMPLAISRARIFWNRTPKRHLTYLDFVQLASEGLLVAIDKFVLPFSAVFRAVIIGRILCNFINCYSETPLHFYPTDKRKLYRANKAVNRFSDIDFDQLANIVNEGATPAHRTTPGELADLMAAASCVSADSLPHSQSSLNGGKETPSIDHCAAQDSYRPDVHVEENDTSRALYEAMEHLDVFERKLLRLYGILL